MVTLARESRGLTQGELAKQIAELQNRPCTQGTISKIEQGLLSVSDEILNGFVKILKYPHSFFSQNEEVYSAGMSQHRKRASLPAKTLCKIDAMTNISRLHVKSLLKSIEDIDLKVPYYDIDEYCDPEKIARMVRQSWFLPRGPIDHVTKIMEKAGVIIIHCDFGTRLIDGVTMNNIDRLPPIIFINKDIPGDRLRFTLSHELGHIVMHKYPSENMEKEADRFASEFLMPTSDIKPDLSYLTLPKLADLKRHWKVAMSALVYKASTLKQITPRQSQYLFMQLSKAGYKTREPAELDIPIETPVLLKQLINIHLNDLNYSINELATILNLEEEELFGYYLGTPPQQRLLSIVK
jgi:Zn-dependent peptidase ImmA (M78 family)/transcriptional regulator with XRE-family HTH domain